MTLVVKKPNKPAFFNSAFDSFFNDFFPVPETPVTVVKSRPAINLVETDDAFRLEIAAPGLQREDFRLHVEDDRLTLDVNKELEEVEGEKVVRKGFSYHSFSRAFRLGEVIDTSAIDAAYEAGVLSITLPKKEEAKAQPPRKIEIA